VPFTQSNTVGLDGKNEFAYFLEVIYMLRFVANAFRGFYAFFLWLNLIICTIGGVIVSGVLFGDYSDGHPILGGILGLAVGLIFNILGGGLVATFLRIDENLKILIRLNGGTPVDGK
jgi:hypothetical protein